jgi:general nucleoside transport system permease protein
MHIQLVKKGIVSKKNAILIKLTAIILAFVAVGIYLVVLGYNPFTVFGSMFQGAYLSSYNFKETIVKAIPILIAALGLSIAFRMNFWNIGAEGQILLGGFGSTFIALNYNHLPMPVLLTLMILASMICGGLWALIPGVFKVKWSTNETIVTLMMNYIALKFITYLQYEAWKDPKAMGFPKIASFEKNAQLPSLFGVNIGWIIAIVLIVFVYIFMKYSKKGFEATVIGESKNTAHYVGININKAMLFSIFLSGAICGIAGFIQTSAVSKTLSTSITANAGNIAIIVAWISNLKPGVMGIVAILFAGFLQGGAYIQIANEIPSALAEIIQAAILFSILGSQFFINYEIRFRRYQTTGGDINDMDN